MKVRNALKTYGTADFLRMPYLLMLFRMTVDTIHPILEHRVCAIGFGLFELSSLPVCLDVEV